MAVRATITVPATQDELVEALLQVCDTAMIGGDQKLYAIKRVERRIASPEASKPTESAPIEEV